MADDIVLTVSEREKRDGIFDCYHDGRYLLSSGSPFLDGCRLLLTQGCNPSACVVMRHAGCNDDALRGILGHVAGVEIAGNGVGFRPFRGRAEMAPAPLVRPPGLPAITLGTSC
jgi:hypothetical protein